MIEWVLAAGVAGLFLLLLPRLIRCTRRSARSRGGSGIWIAIGMGIAMILDAKAAAATEIVERKRDEAEDAESGDRP